MEIRTHHAIDRELCGTPEAVAEGTAIVSLATTLRMATDDHGLVHGGFVFGLADHAAMLAINEPTVVLGAAELRFLVPVRAGQRVVAVACVVEPKAFFGGPPGSTPAASKAFGDDQGGPPKKPKKILVDVEVRADEVMMLTGRFTCFVPPRHVLAPEPEKETTP